MPSPRMTVRLSRAPSVTEGSTAAVFVLAACVSLLPPEMFWKLDGEIPKSMLVVGRGVAVGLGVALGRGVGVEVLTYAVGAGV